MVSAVKDIIRAAKGFTYPTPREQANKEAIAKADCRAKGGRWDEATKSCVMPTQTTQPKQEEQNKPAPPGSVVTNSETGEPAGFINSKGQFVKAGREDIQLQVDRKLGKTAPIEGGVTAEQFAQQQEGQRLAGQVGEFGQLGVSPTGLDFGEAAAVGIRDAIPRALTLAGGAAVAGATAGALTGGALSVPLAAAAAGVTFMGSITASIISNFKSQRTDTTTAQQRVLDEGKQNMQGWATAAASDPSNKPFYLSEFNKQAALINQAYRQMVLDTSRDFAKLETAIPNLAEFETFYLPGGERDEISASMRVALQTPSPEGYNLLALKSRQDKNNE